MNIHSSSHVAGNEAANSIFSNELSSRRTDEHSLACNSLSFQELEHEYKEAYNRTQDQWERETLSQLLRCSQLAHPHAVQQQILLTENMRVDGAEQDGIHAERLARFRRELPRFERALLQQRLQEARTVHNAHYIDATLQWVKDGLDACEIDGKLEQWQMRDTSPHLQEVTNVVIAHIAEIDPTL